MITLPLVEIKLLFPEKLKPSDVPKLRGFFGRRFIDQPLFHHHRPDGGYIYSYPLIQYKIIEEGVYLIGIKDGGEILLSIWNEIDAVEFENSRLPIWETRIRKYEADFGELKQKIDYKFLAPWLALNQKILSSGHLCTVWGRRNY